MTPNPGPGVLRFIVWPVLRRTFREEPSIWITLAVGLPLLALLWPIAETLRAPAGVARGLLAAGWAWCVVQAFRRPRPGWGLLAFMRQSGCRDFRRGGALGRLTVLRGLPPVLLALVALCPQAASLAEAWWIRPLYVLGGLGLHLPLAAWRLGRLPEPRLHGAEAGRAARRGPAGPVSVRRVRLAIHLRAYLPEGNALAASLLGAALLLAGALYIALPAFPKPEPEYRAGLFNAWALVALFLLHQPLESASNLVNTRWYAQAGLDHLGMSREVLRTHLKLLLPALALMAALAPVAFWPQASADGVTGALWATLQAWLVLGADWLFLGLAVWLLGFYPLRNSSFLNAFSLGCLLVLGLYGGFAAPLAWVALLGGVGGLLVWRQKRMAS